MYITLYGDEPFLAQQKLKEIIGNYKKTQQSGLSFYSFDASSGADFDDFKDALDVVSMFAEKKLIVLKNFFLESGEIARNIFQYADKSGVRDSKDIVVVFFESGKPKATKEFKKLLEKPNLSQEFLMVEGDKLLLWIRKEFEKNGSSIDQASAMKLADFCGNDMYRLKNEIDKLASYKKIISAKDVADMVVSDFKSDIFAIIDAIAKKDKKLSLNILNDHIEHGESEIYLLSMIVYQFRNLIKIKSLAEENISQDDMAKKSGLHPFVAKKTLAASRLFSMDDLKNIYQKLFDIDLKMKIGEVEPQMALNIFVAEL